MNRETLIAVYYGSLFTLGLATAGATPIHAATPTDAPPWTAYVTGEEPIRSGPGNSYYPTQSLQPGSEVEVYQSDPTGWCAIRPPTGNFSWVLASAVHIVSPGVGEVIRDQAPSRIGSLLAESRDVVHVRLKRSERLQILGSELIDDVSWYRVAPPAGEFRWIHQRGLSDTPPEKSADASASPPATADMPVTEADDPAASTAHAEQPAEWQAAPEALASEAISLASTNEVAEPGPSSDSKSAATAASATGESTSKATPPEGATPDPVWRELVALEVQLSRMVVEKPTLWDFQAIETQAADLMTHATKEDQRTAIRDLADRVQRFATLRQRLQQAPLPGPLAVPADHSAGGRLPPTTAAGNVVNLGPGYSDSQDPRQSAAREKFDAIGILRPVVSRRPNAPQYALVNDKGQIVTFVTPTPDLNLQAYLGQRVGITGTRGYMTELNQRHLTAGRVQPVETRTLR